MKSSNKLLLCPFCSSERLSIYHDNYSCSCKVQCECGCSFEYADDCMTKDELEKHVIEKWNKRRKRVERRQRREKFKPIVFFVKKTRKTTFFCSGCNDELEKMQRKCDVCGQLVDWSDYE